MTCEEPVEYMIPGINQVNVKKEVGLTFAAGLRAFLRQDPDIILVGEIINNQPGDKITLYKGRGCERCSGTGYKGRIGIHEVLEINEDIREAIVRKAPPHELAALAAKNNMMTLRMSCTHKMLKGLTTMEELLRITMEH